MTGARNPGPEPFFSATRALQCRQRNPAGSVPDLSQRQTDSTASASAPRASSAAHRVVPVTARLATVADSLDSNLESCCDPTMSASRSNPGAFFAPKWHSQLAWNQCEPSIPPFNPAMSRFRRPSYRFEARWRSGGLIGAHPRRRVSTSAARRAPVARAAAPTAWQPILWATCTRWARRARARRTTLLRRGGSCRLWRPCPHPPPSSPPPPRCRRRRRPCPCRPCRRCNRRCRPRRRPTRPTRRRCRPRPRPSLVTSARWPQRRAHCRCPSRQ